MPCFERDFWLRLVQETPPAGSQDKYQSLRESEDRVTQRFVERYDTLVRQQEWSSQDNKQKVLAKYVAHDPNFKWVKLATVRGSGANRVAREVTVPLEKLSKTSQSRVRQIAKVQEKLDELLAAGPGAGREGAADGGSEYGGEYGSGSGRGMRVGRPGDGGYGSYGGYEAPATDSASDGAAATESSVEDAHIRLLEPKSIPVPTTPIHSGSAS